MAKEEGDKGDGHEDDGAAFRMQILSLKYCFPSKTMKTHTNAKTINTLINYSKGKYICDHHVTRTHKQISLSVTDFKGQQQNVKRHRNQESLT